jgi:hypothetical protein
MRDAQRRVPDRFDDAAPDARVAHADTDAAATNATIASMCL